MMKKEIVHVMVCGYVHEQQQAPANGGIVEYTVFSHFDKRIFTKNSVPSVK